MRYKITCRCRACGHRWSRITKDPESPDPPCPRVTRYDEDGKPLSTCGTEVTPVGLDLSLNKAPAAIGGNIHIKAIDETQKIVTEDYGLSDIRSDVRIGESAAPKLAPQQQAMADAFFNGGRKQAAPAGMTGNINLARHARAAMSGALSDAHAESASIGAVHRNKLRPPVRLVADDRQLR